MLPPRQLTTFILLSTACAALVAVYSSNPSHDASTRAVTEIGSVSDHAVAATLPPVVVTEYHPENQPAQDTSNNIAWLLEWDTAQAVRSAVRQIEDMTEDIAEDIEPDAVTDWRLASENEIPFPLYPNGTRYRIGGEHGMKIALFETTDDFSTVDAYYDQKAPSSGLARKSMTEDYVQYLKPGDGTETAAVTSEAQLQSQLGDQPGIQPGVLIHEFFDADEALKLGAAPNSRTNIIISFW